MGIESGVGLESRESNAVGGFYRVTREAVLEGS